MPIIYQKQGFLIFDEVYEGVDVFLIIFQHNYLIFTDQLHKMQPNDKAI